MSGNNRVGLQKDKMKIYTVYLKPDGDKTLQSAVLVPEGYSWLALLFPFNMISAITHKNWAFLMVLLLYFITAIAQFHDPLIDGIIISIKLALFPFLGVWANDFLRLSLKHAGYYVAGIVSGSNESEAQLRFFEEISSANYSNFHA